MTPFDNLLSIASALWPILGENFNNQLDTIFDRMEQGIKIILFYYFGSFILALVFGLTFGFTDSHTPPLTFLFELFIIPVGLIWLTVDLIMLRIRKGKSEGRISAHLVGLLANGLLVAYILTY